jgi:hypothetical protein
MPIRTPPTTVGEGVMELAQHRRAPILEVVYQRHRPQRSGPVEILHPGDPRHLEYPGEVARLSRSHPSDVEVEIEVEVVYPAWRRRCGRFDHALPEHRQVAGHEVDPVAHLIPVRRLLQ